MKKQQALVLSVVNLILALTTIVVNILANALPLNGKNTGVLSDQYPNLFVPAGLTFGIWGVIYLLFLVYTISALSLAIKDSRRAETTIPGQWAFGLSCILNMAWIFAWHYEKIGLSVIIMLALLGTLLFLFTLQRRQKEHHQMSLASIIPIDVYTGWITVATIANITVFLVAVSWNAWGISANIWTMIMIVIGALIGGLVLLRYQSLSYAAVLVWAYLGIIIKRSQSTPVYQDIILTTWIAIGFLVVMMLQATFVLLKREKERKNA